MAIVQKSSLTVNSASTITPSLTGVTAGNTLVLVVTAVGWTDNTPTDSAGQTWSKAAFLSGSGASVAVYYLLSANAGTHTLSATGGGSTFINWSLCEIPPCTAVDVVSTLGTATNTATTLSSPSITTTNANDALFALIVLDTATGSTNANVSNPPTGWTSVFAEQNTSANAGCSHAYKEVSATGAQSATWTFNADATGSIYQSGAVSFKLAAAGGAALAGAGIASAAGSGSLTPRAQFAGAGVATARGSGALSGGAVLSGSGLVTTSGSAALTVKPQFSGAGVAKAAGGGSLTVPSGSLTVTLKQKWSQQVSVGNPATLVLGSNPMTVTAGDTLICVTSGADNNTQPTATDSAGTFTIPTNGRQNANGSDNIWCSIAYQANAAGGSHTITPGAVNAGGGGEIAHWIIEVTNMPATASIRGVFFTNAINTNGSWSGSSDTSVQAGDIAFVLGMYENTSPGGTSDISDPPSGWTSVGQSELNSTTFTPTTVAYKVVPTSGVAVTANYATTDPTISEHVSIMLVLVPNAGGVSFMGAGISTAAGSGSLTARPKLSGDGSSGGSGVGSLTTRAPLAGSGSDSAAGSASLRTAAAPAGAGLAQAAGSAALSVTTVFAGAGSVNASGSASLTTGSIGANLAGAGTGRAIGAASLTVSAALAGSGSAGSTGSATLTGGSAAVSFVGAGNAQATGSGALTTAAALAGGGFSIATAAGVLTIGGGGVSFAGNGTAATSGAAALIGRPRFAGAGVASVVGVGTLALASSFVAGNQAVWLVSARNTVAHVSARQIVAQATD